MLVALGALMVFVGFITPAHAANQNLANASFEEVPCWNPVGQETASTCGFLDVPEDWEAPGDRRIRLPVVSFAAEDQKEDAPVVVFLVGGPGGSTRIDTQNVRDRWRRFARNAAPGHDLITFDQRGAPLSQPALHCPGMRSLGNWADVSEDPDHFDDPWQREKATLTACHQELTGAGHNLAAYNSDQSAADIEALLDALGYDQVILIGVSYGTHLAQAAMSRFPERIAAVVLDSVLYAPSRRRDHFEQSLQPFQRLIEACQEHERCHKAYPDLRQNFIDVLGRLEEAPLILEVWNPEASGTPLYARVDRNTLLYILYDALFRNQQITQIPWILNGLAKERDAGLIPYVENFLNNAFLRDVAFGMSASIWCQDFYDGSANPPDPEGDDLAAQIGSWSDFMRANDLCSYWPTGRIQRPAPGPFQSDAPVLLLSGAFDPTTTVEFADDLAVHLPNSRHFVFPATGHGQMRSDDCAFEIVTLFIADPSQWPAPICLNDLRQPAFLSLGGG